MAEQGSYKDLSNNPDGAFTKLMEWQMSGGETEGVAGGGGGIANERSKGPPDESERALEGLGEGEEDVDEEGLKVRKGNESKSEVVLEKAGKAER